MLLYVLLLTFSLNVYGSRIYQDQKPKTKRVTSSGNWFQPDLLTHQLAALEAVENPTDAAIFELYKRSLPASKSYLPRFLNLLKKSHPKPENNPEKFVTLMTNFAKHLPCNKVEMLMTIKYLLEVFESQSKEKGKYESSYRRITGIHTIYWMFLHPHAWIESDHQTVNPLLHDLYAKLFPLNTFEHEMSQTKMVTHFDSFFYGMEHYREVSLAFFILAAASKPSFISVDNIKNNLQPYGIISNPYFQEILALKYFGPQYSSKTQLEMDRSFFHALRPLLLNQLVTDEMVLEMYAYTNFYSKQVTMENLGERQILIINGLFSLMKTFDRHLFRNISAIRTNIDRIKRELSRMNKLFLSR
jgi:hypothetical protein